MILSAALKELGIDSIYLNPRVREIIDEMAGVERKVLILNRNLNLEFA